jgi:hypothetical protein
MKNTMLSIGIAGMTTVLLSSFAIMQKSNEVQEPKKGRHIKMIKMENGKKMELDTVLTGDDVFVWNGDTINPVKHINGFNRPGFGRMRQFDVNVDRRGGKGYGMIFKHNGRGNGGPAFGQMQPRDGMDVITENMDSDGKRIVLRKMMRGGNQNDMIHFNGPGMRHFPSMPSRPPRPPMPPAPQLKMMRIQHSGQVIDLNDPNIISFKKKKMSGDREKIEIIRKKSANDENTSFNINFDDTELIAPEFREFNLKSDGDSIRMKVLEKKKVIKGKDGKEIEVNVETKENK